MTQMPCELPPHTLPEALPIFPLAGVLLLPRGRLPLHVFETRYVAMVEDVLVGDRLIGMIQPFDPACRDDAPAVYPIGCAGRVTAFRDLEDGRYLITLTGLCRFRVGRELDGRNGYRRIAPVWDGFLDDLHEEPVPPLDRSRLLGALPCYLEDNEIVADWKTITGAPDERLVTSLAMVCPFQPNEKQALLEAPTLGERAELLTSLVEMAVVDARLGGRCVCH
ncbi:MAG: LON peptidase substrate-binding domain-containing protein [Rhodospirillaceae bacterium]